MAVNDVYRGTIKMNAPSNDAQNVIHYRVTTASGSEAEDLATILEADWWDSIRAVMSTLYTGNSIEVRGVTDPNQGFDLPLTTNGGSASEALPFQNAAIVRWRTTQVGRSFRGRNYLPGMTEAGQSGGVLTSATQTVLQQIMDGVLDIGPGGPGGAAFRLVVYSRKLGTNNLVNTAQVMPNLRTQRRRQRQ